MREACNLYVEELKAYFAERGKRLSRGVVRALSNPPLDYTSEEREFYYALVAPAEGLIKYALRERLEADALNRERWVLAFPRYSHTAIGSMVAELLLETDPCIHGARRVLEMAGNSAGTRLDPDDQGMDELEAGRAGVLNAPEAKAKAVVEGAHPERDESKVFTEAGRLSVAKDGNGERSTEMENGPSGAEGTEAGVDGVKKGAGAPDPPDVYRETGQKGTANKPSRWQKKGRKDGTRSDRTGLLPKRLKPLLRFLEWVLTFALALVFLFAAFLMIAPRFGMQAHPVLSGSMEPSLKVGGMILCRSVPVEEIGVGDVIGFNTPDGTKVTHRVIAIEDEDGKRWFQTKGDANEDPDPSLVSITDDKVDKVILHLPYIGFFVRFMRTRFAFFLFMCVPATLLFLIFGRDLWKGIVELREEKRKAESRLGGGG